jgi:inorganic pyrophosphatase
MKVVFLAFAFLFVFAACDSDKGFDDFKTYSKAGKPNFVVMNPAGSTEKFQYDNKTNKFRVRTTNRVNETVSFLPYPANYGFFPSTHSDSLDKGELLYGFLISESYSIQTLIEVLPIGALSTIQNGKNVDIVFSVPEDKTLRMKMTTTDSVPEELRSTFETWLTRAYMVDGILDWHDSKYALELVKNRSNR